MVINTDLNFLFYLALLLLAMNLSQAAQNMSTGATLQSYF